MAKNNSSKLNYSYTGLSNNISIKLSCDDNDVQAKLLPFAGFLSFNIEVEFFI